MFDSIQRPYSSKSDDSAASCGFLHDVSLRGAIVMAIEI